MIKQISVFLTNQPGMLSKLTKTLMDKNINIRAMTVAETSDYGILRIIVDKLEDCVKVLKEDNYLISETDVLAVEIPDKPGALHEIAKNLGDNGVNIEYLYSTLVKTEALIILRVDNNDRATKILKSKGFKMVEKQAF